MITATSGIAVGIGAGAIIVISLLFAIIKRLIKINKAQNKTLLKHEKHLFGKESAASLAKDLGKVNFVQRNSKKVTKHQKLQDAIQKHIEKI